MIMGNPSGKVDVIAHGNNEVYKQLPIDLMHCSLVQGTHLFIGAANKLYLIDMAQDFKIVSSCSFKRQVSTICAMSQTQFVVG